MRGRRGRGNGETWNGFCGVTVVVVGVMVDKMMIIIKEVVRFLFYKGL